MFTTPGLPLSSFISGVSGVFGEHPCPSWKIGIMEYWNDEARRRKTKNLFFSDFNTHYSTIPTIQHSNSSKDYPQGRFQALFPWHRKRRWSNGHQPMNSTEWFAVWWGIFFETLANDERLSVWLSGSPAP